MTCNSQMGMLNAMDAVEKEFGTEMWNDLAVVVDNLKHQLPLADHTELNKLVMKINKQKDFYKNEYPQHLVDQSDVAEHCRQHAFSCGSAAPASGSWVEACMPLCTDHVHQQSCDKCSQRFQIIQETKNLILKVLFVSY